TMLPNEQDASSRKNESVFDIVIVGGGITGSSLACTLVSSDITQSQRVALVEFSDVSHLKEWKPPKNEFSNRVGADGLNSVVRSFTNIESLGWDYNAHAIVATLHVDPLIENATAWQRFLPTGSVAMLPLENDSFNIGDEFEWRHNVESREAKSRLPPLVLGVQKKSRAMFPLRMRNSESYVKERVVLVGDAAHTIHPLAGQGLNQGLEDVQCLAKVIEHGIITGQDIDYSSARYFSNVLMLGAVDKLHKLFGTKLAPIVLARSLGLRIVNNIEPLK
ncbi:11666_t:CDS:2, partial [Acaulospora colombiana]